MTVLKGIIWTCGDYIWVRRNGEILKRIFIEPFSADFFVAQDRWGDNEIYHWNLIYGDAEKSDPWKMENEG